MLVRFKPAMFGTIPPPTRSAPEQNPWPAPVSTTTRQSLSRLISRSASRNGIITSNAIAFMRSGRLSVTSVTCGRGFSISMKDMRGSLRTVCRRAAGVQHAHVEMLHTDARSVHVIVLGVILALLGLLLSVPVLWVIGLVLIVVGAVLWIAGSVGHEVGGRRHYY